MLEVGKDTFVRPTPNLGVGAYLPYGARISCDLARISLFSKHAITAWQFACFLAFWLIHVVIVIRGITSIKWLEAWAAHG